MTWKTHIAYVKEALDDAWDEVAAGFYDLCFGRMSCPFWLPYEMGAMDVFKADR